MKTRGKADGQRADAERPNRALAFALLVWPFYLLSAGCAAEQTRSGLPPEAQGVIEEVSGDIAAGRFEEVYAEAAEEWRQAVSAEESRKMLERVRAALGRVQSRAAVSAVERGSAGARSLNVTYNTKFERADAIETFALVERGGRWRVARYSVNSNALKP